jgi:hypothetical protein
MNPWQIVRNRPPFRRWRWIGEVMGAVDAVPHERHLGQALVEHSRPHAVTEAGVVAVAERSQQSSRALAACTAGRPKAERCGARGRRERIRRPPGQLLLVLGVEGVPLLMGPAVHAHLVSAAHDPGDLVRSLLAEPSFDEHCRGQPSPLEDVE